MAIITFKSQYYGKHLVLHQGSKHFQAHTWYHAENVQHIVAQAVPHPAYVVKAVSIAVQAADRAKPSPRRQALLEDGERVELGVLVEPCRRRIAPRHQRKTRVIE
jgi:hypothetical protein